jgi:hypothetical protein
MAGPFFKPQFTCCDKDDMGARQTFVTPIT